MNTNRPKRFSYTLTIESFRIILDINNNAIPTTLNNRTRYYSIEEMEEANYFQYGSDDIYNDAIAKKCKINTWRKDYFLFLERNIDSPRKTTINSE